jgi:hypothetical protein
MAFKWSNKCVSCQTIVYCLALSSSLSWVFVLSQQRRRAVLRACPWHLLQAWHLPYPCQLQPYPYHRVSAQRHPPPLLLLESAGAGWAAIAIYLPIPSLHTVALLVAAHHRLSSTNYYVRTECSLLHTIGLVQLTTTCVPSARCCTPLPQGAPLALGRRRVEWLPHTRRVLGGGSQRNGSVQRSDRCRNFLLLCSCPEVPSRRLAVERTERVQSGLSRVFVCALACISMQTPGGRCKFLRARTMLQRILVCVPRQPVNMMALRLSRPTVSSRLGLSLRSARPKIPCRWSG